MNVEEQIQRSIFSKDSEKTYIDKLLSKSEVETIRKLQKKNNLNRSELLELMYSCLSIEAKLINLGEWDRYIVLKYFVWIRELIKVAELMYDNADHLRKKERKGTIKLSDRAKVILNKNQLLMEHNAKFLIDLYLNIVRTTLSLGGTGFLELLKNKFEMSYPEMQVAQQQQQPQKWSLGGKK